VGNLTEKAEHYFKWW